MSEEIAKFTKPFVLSPLRPAVGPLDAVARAALIEKARQNLAEVNQIFIDADHWNRFVRKSDELPLCVDSNGELATLRTALEEFLRHEDTSS